MKCVIGGLPRAWSTPSLSPYVRNGLKPPLLQQAAFDDIVFKVDVMRNVASRHKQNEEDEQQKQNNSIEQIKKWSSLPALNLTDVEERKSSEDEGQNGDEGLQEVRNHIKISSFGLFKYFKLKTKKILYTGCFSFLHLLAH